MTSLDPVVSLSDFARLSARLATPYAQPAAIHAEAGTTSALLQQAAARWQPELLAQPELQARYSSAFAAERTRVQLGRVPRAAPGAGGAASALDETALAAPVPSIAPLPFQHGRFSPAPTPVEPRAPRVEADPDATQLPVPDPHQTLPFPKPAKPRRTP